MRCCAQFILDRLHSGSWRYLMCMDVLSDAIGVMRTGRPHSALAERRGRWAVRHPPFAGAGFHVVLQGTCELIPEEGAAIALGVGDTVFLPHGSAHALSDGISVPQAGSPVTPLPELDNQVQPDGAVGSTVLLCGAYLFERGRAHPLMDELPQLIHLPAHVGRHSSLRAAIDLLGSELEHRRPGMDAVVSALLDALLTYMVRSWFAETSDRHAATGWSAALADPAIVGALGAMHGDPARQWTVGELAARTGLSRSAFARRFTALVGRPPLTYLGWWRMTMAAKRLRESDVPLSAVAKQIGYTSEFAFANAFKREYGIAPGRYRRQGPSAPP
jgi:AraC-like DNA-binding protein